MVSHTTVWPAPLAEGPETVAAGNGHGWFAEEAGNMGEKR